MPQADLLSFSTQTFTIFFFLIVLFNIVFFFISPVWAMAGKTLLKNLINFFFFLSFKKANLSIFFFSNLHTFGNKIDTDFELKI
jgi:hypothetical protein